MGPKPKSSGAGNSDMPNGSRKVFPFSEKINVLDLRGKKSYADVATMYIKKKSTVCEIVEEEKEICASLPGERETTFS